LIGYFATLRAMRHCLFFALFSLCRFDAYFRHAACADMVSVADATLLSLMIISLYAC